MAQDMLERTASDILAGKQDGKPEADIPEPDSRMACRTALSNMELDMARERIALHTATSTENKEEDSNYNRRTYIHRRNSLQVLSRTINSKAL